MGEPGRDSRNQWFSSASSVAQTLPIHRRAILLTKSPSLIRFGILNCRAIPSRLRSRNTSDRAGTIF